MGVLNVNMILSAWCAFCDHLAPFAAMAVVPLLLWIHHVETMPPADALSSTEVIDLSPGATEKGVATADTLEGWAA